MASVSELKAALETEQQRAVEIADQALSAVSTISTVSALAITLLGLLIAILAFFGYGRIKSSSISAAEKIAESHLDSHVETEKFKKLMEKKLDEAVQKRWQSTVVVSQFQAPEKVTGEASPFPEQEDG